MSKCVRALHFALLGFETYCSNSLSMSSLHTANRTVNKTLEFQLCERGCSLSDAFEGTRQPSFHKPIGMVELRWFSNGPRVDGFNTKLQTLLNGLQRQTLKATERASKSSCFLACSSCFPVWPFAELLDEGCSFSDFVCMLCSAWRGRSPRKNPKHTVAWDMGR